MFSLDHSSTSSMTNDSLGRMKTVCKSTKELRNKIVMSVIRYIRSCVILAIGSQDGRVAQLRPKL